MIDYALHIGYIKNWRKWNHPIYQFKAFKHPLTILLSADRIECLSAWRNLSIKLHSRRRWSTMASALLSKHDNMILSTWWCNELLYGYLYYQGMLTLVKKRLAIKISNNATSTNLKNWKASLISTCMFDVALRALDPRFRCVKWKLFKVASAWMWIMDPHWLIWCKTEHALHKTKLIVAYSKKRSMTRWIVPELTMSFSATSFPVFRRTAMNSTIWNK